ncbi:bis(5'-nucleosyl)-tetraphosphatase (symmetrical) YqeK [Oscillospiraceae bacterium NTUH-002-81]|nr:bis(5'-nucleosyl)-tetraphosphatase (symmetrical) YqeK [Oscillospiraceae bacterium NTUH-002-81]
MSEAYDLKKIKKKLKNELDESRYEHTIGVMDTAACLAMRYGADLTQALVAGLLHDCAKCIPNDKKLKLCKKNGIEVTPFEEKAPFLLHAKLGAWMAEHEYHVSDPAILSAIACHTTGKPDMSLLDKIVFIADYIEPGRNKAPGLPEIRRLSFTDIDQALIRILSDTLDYLASSNDPIDPATQNVLDYYLRREQAS